MSHTCRICSNCVQNQTLVCRENMFGWGDEFLYFTCFQCGCLQIANPPSDLARFYPSHYYSFHSQLATNDSLKSWLASQRDRLVITGQKMPQRLLALFAPSHHDLTTLARIPLAKESRILDVGCGQGQLLSYLHRAGFCKLSGIDPYISSDTKVVNDVFVRKQNLAEVKGEFDVIMLHHVFEHMDTPLSTLQHCRSRLSPHGKIFLRFPTVDSEAWESYGKNWVQLDAPRHLFLHTRRSLEILSKQAGLVVKDWWCDSAAFQFWGSELYQKSIALISPDGQLANPASHFSKATLREFAVKSKKLNQANRGDQVAVLLAVKN